MCSSLTVLIMGNVSTVAMSADRLKSRNSPLNNSDATTRFGVLTLSITHCVAATKLPSGSSNCPDHCRCKLVESKDVLKIDEFDLSRVAPFAILALLALRAGEINLVP